MVFSCFGNILLMRVVYCQCFVDEMLCYECWIYMLMLITYDVIGSHFNQVGTYWLFIINMILMNNQLLYFIRENYYFMKIICLEVITSYYIIFYDIIGHVKKFCVYWISLEINTYISYIRWSFNHSVGLSSTIFIEPITKWCIFASFTSHSMHHASICQSILI